MVVIKPFKGLVVNRNLAQNLVSPPYDVINSKEARKLANGNPTNFLHVKKPEIDLPEDTNPYADIVYQTGRNNLNKFIQQGWLERDTEARFYIYSQEMKGITQYGLISASSVADYETDQIKKHEKTLKPKEADRTKLTDVLGANVGPVWLTYKSSDNVSIQNKMTSIAKNQEPYSKIVQNLDENDIPVQHTLWKCDSDLNNFFESEFNKVPNTYVADGHHRSAAAYNVGKLRKQRAIEAGKQITGLEDFNYFMSIIYPSDNLRIMDYNRVIRDLNGLSQDQFISKLEECYTLTKTEMCYPKHKYQATLLLDNQWYTCDTKPHIIQQALSSLTKQVDTLDVQILNDQVLKNILNIHDVRNDQRIDFVGGSRGLEGLAKRCKEDCVAAFAMYPINIDDLLQVADSGMCMPPKSTWFEPKPRSGFVVRLLED